MGAKESGLKVNTVLSNLSKSQAWCNSSTLICKSCVTEVENVNTEIKRTSPMPKTEMQQLIRD